MTSSRRGASRASRIARCVRPASSITPQELRPDLDEDAAGRQASAAIHYASVFHTKWLWHRVGDPKYWNDDAAKVAQCFPPW
jgi:hypothetical protein